jgi:hypothetical protein
VPPIDGHRLSDEETDMLYLDENCYISRIVEEKRAGKCVGLWVEGWTGSMWTRDVSPSIGMNTVEDASPAPLSILVKAGVPDEPFPPDYKLPELAKNRWGI